MEYPCWQFFYKNVCVHKDMGVSLLMYVLKYLKLSTRKHEFNKYLLTENQHISN